MPRYRPMTVAHVREPPGADAVDVAFLESARFYRLSRTNPRFAEALKLLRDAMREGRKLDIRVATPDGDIIEEVRTCAGDTA